MMRSAFIGVACGSGALLFVGSSFKLHEHLVAAGYAAGDAALMIFAAWFSIGILGALISRDNVK